MGGDDASLDERLWVLDLWSREWAVVPLEGHSSPVGPHLERAEGTFRGRVFPRLGEGAPSARSLAALANIPSDETSAHGADVLVFGGQGAARAFHDDLHALSLATLHRFDSLSVCAAALLTNSTAARRWARCKEHGCPPEELLRRALCEGYFQPVGYL